MITRLIWTIWTLMSSVPQKADKLNISRSRSLNLSISQSISISLDLSLSIVCSTVFKAQIKENIKAPCHWPLWGEFTGDRWIPRTKGVWHGKSYRLMLSWNQLLHWYIMLWNFIIVHDDVIKWKHFPHYWPFVWGIHRWQVNSLHKGQWRGALMFSLICGGVNSREAGDLRHHHTHYDVTVMLILEMTGHLWWQSCHHDNSLLSMDHGQNCLYMKQAPACDITSGRFHPRRLY